MGTSTPTTKTTKTPSGGVIKSTATPATCIYSSKKSTSYSTKSKTSTKTPSVSGSVKTPTTSTTTPTPTVSTTSQGPTTTPTTSTTTPTPTISSSPVPASPVKPTYSLIRPSSSTLTISSSRSAG